MSAGSSLSDERIAEVTKEIRAVQDDWLEQISSGDYNYCANIYMEDAIVFAPTNTFRGREEIRGNLKFLMETLLGDGQVMRCWDRVFYVCSEKRAVMVSGKWAAGDKGGNILLEDWYKQDDGSWKILIDCYDTNY